MKHIIYLKEQLLAQGRNEFAVGVDVGLIMAGHKGEYISDACCAIITSTKYLNLKHDN